MSRPVQTRAIGFKTAVALLLVFIAGCAIRFVPWSNFITPEGVYFLEGDNYEHLHKITAIVSNFPWAPPYDYYVGFPVGTGNIISPLFDITFAGLVKAAFWTAPSKEKIEFISAVMPPFMGMLAIIPLFLWCRATFGKGVALASVAILAILPAHIFTTIVARPDNEVLEPFWMALLFYSYVSSLAAAVPEDSGPRPSLIRASIATGAVASLALLYWRGALLWWGIISAHMLLSIIVSGWKGDKAWKDHWLSGLVIFSVTAVFVAIICLAGVWGMDSGIQFNIISWFHVIFSLLSIAAFSSVALVFHLREARGLSGFKAASAGVILLAGALLLSIFAAPQYFSGIIGGAAVVGGANKWTSTIAQYQPLLTGPSGAFDFNAVRLSTLLLFTVPFVIAAISGRLYKDRDSKTLFFSFAGSVIFVAALVNGRYENVLALIVAVSGGLLFRYVRDRVRGAAGWPVALAIFVILLIPTYPFYRDLSSTGPAIIRGDLEESLLWIRDHTPKTDYLTEPWKKPQYGVMARWEYGGWIEYIAERPSVATLYGSETHGLKESAELFLSSDEGEFLRIMDENQARYLVISKTIGALPEYAKIIGRDTGGYLVEQKDETGEVVWSTGPRFFDLAHIRLYFADGVGYESPMPLRPVPGMRLVHESAGTSDIRGFFQEVKNVKVFERVKGATVVGSIFPGAQVFLGAIVTTDQGRKFQVVEQTVADASGRFSIKAWYPSTDGFEGKVAVVGPYVIQAAGRQAPVRITEEDVVEGRTIRLN